MGNNCCGFSCPVEATIQLIGGKYKAVILWHLMNKTLRYNDELCNWGEQYLIQK